MYKSMLPKMILLMILLLVVCGCNGNTLSPDIPTASNPVPQVVNHQDITIEYLPDMTRNIVVKYISTQFSGTLRVIASQELLRKDFQPTPNWRQEKLEVPCANWDQVVTAELLQGTRLVKGVEVTVPGCSDDNSGGTGGGGNNPTPIPEPTPEPEPTPTPIPTPTPEPTPTPIPEPTQIVIYMANANAGRSLFRYSCTGGCLHGIADARIEGVTLYSEAFVGPVIQKDIWLDVPCGDGILMGRVVATNGFIQTMGANTTKVSPCN